MKLDLYLAGSHNVLTFNEPEKEMNIAKNMESIFVAAVVVAISVANAIAAPAAPLQVASRTIVEKSPVMESPMITIVVVGKRLTAEEKAKRA